jgi:hypothetical protein
MIGGQGTAPKGVGRAVNQAEHLLKGSLLKNLELELHGFSAHHIAEIILPEFPIAPEMVDQKFESQPPPEGQ